MNSETSTPSTRSLFATVFLGACVFVLLCVVFVALALLGTYNSLVRGSNGVDSQWGTVQSVYQRRYDLIPNLVETVKGVAGFEKETLTGIAQARASVGQIKYDKAPDKAQMEAFAGQQQNLGTALSRLLMVTENYPQLKATDAFRDLQAQIEGTENRIAVERRNYNKAVEVYNNDCQFISGRLVRMFATFEPKTFFTVQDKAAEAAPKVSFSTPVAPSK